MNHTIGVALVGCGGIALQNHVPGLAYCPETALVGVCDVDQATVDRAAQATGAPSRSTDYREIVTRDDVDAVIIATPNRAHAPIALEAIAAGKHVLCEKPLAMSLEETRAMWIAARDAKLRHMVAFTYRFTPAMRLMRHLVGEGFIGRPYHFRSLRLQDWGARNIGWRQSRDQAATGELGDMLSHRIDFAHTLMGPMRELVADERRFHETREGTPSDLEDWVGVIARFDSGASGMLESSKVATGVGEGGFSPDRCEIVGEKGALVYELGDPNHIWVGRAGRSGYEREPVPESFLKVEGSLRDPHEGDPVQVFRYDQVYEFVAAIREGRDCVPSFDDGICVQSVMDAVAASISSGSWARVDYNLDYDG